MAPGDDCWVAYFEDGHGQYYVHLSKFELESFYVAITSIILMHFWPILVIFDLGSTFLYVSAHFTFGIDIMCDSIGVPICVATW